MKNIEDTQGAGPLALKAQLLFLRTLMKLAPFLPLVFLLLILVLAIRSLSELGRWWGIPLIITAALSAILTAFYRATLISVLSLGPLSEAPPVVLDEAIGVSMRLAAEIFRPMMWQSLVILVLGLLLFTVGLVLKPRAAE